MHSSLPCWKTHNLNPLELCEHCGTTSGQPQNHLENPVTNHLGITSRQPRNPLRTPSGTTSGQPPNTLGSPRNLLETTVKPPWDHFRITSGQAIDTVGIT